MIGIQNVPQTGCNVFNGNYFDNYTNGTRTRYYIYDGQAIATSTQSYQSIPQNSLCANLNDLEYDPLNQALLIAGIVVGVIAVIVSAYMVVIKPFIKTKKG